ncbi:MAG: MbtF [Desulfovibrionaceae bacterium]|nr:MbtF [Desulfovibrionaceae bacterium]
MLLKKTAKMSRLLLPALCLALLLPACASRDDGVEPTGMTISVTLRDVHRCSRLSPEIMVENAPQGTTSYQVRLLEYRQDGERFLGGGTWKEDGTGVIPEGALTQYYRGPCPAQGQSGEYGFVVAAYGSNAVQPLSVRLYQFTQE